MLATCGFKKIKITFFSHKQLFQLIQIMDKVKIILIYDRKMT